MEIQPLVFSLVLAIITIIIFWIEERIRIRRDKANVLPRTWNFYLKCFAIVAISSYGLMSFYQMNPVAVTASTMLLTQTVVPSSTPAPADEIVAPLTLKPETIETVDEPISLETEIVIPKFQDENIKIPIAPEVPAVTLEPIPEDVPVIMAEEDMMMKQQQSSSSHKKKKRHHIGTAPF